MHLKESINHKLFTTLCSNYRFEEAQCTGQCSDHKNDNEKEFESSHSVLCSDRHGVGVILTVLASVGLEVRRHCNCDIGRPLKVVQKGLSKCIKLELRRLHNM